MAPQGVAALFFCLATLATVAIVPVQAAMKFRVHAGFHLSRHIGSPYQPPDRLVEHGLRYDGGEDGRFIMHTSVRELPKMLQSSGSVSAVDEDSAPAAVAWVPQQYNRWNWKSYLVAEEECADRVNFAATTEKRVSLKYETGVVISVCAADISQLESLSCEDVWYNIYSTCKIPAQTITNVLQRLSACLTVTRLPGLSRSHTYLKHIIDRYDKLPSRVLFMDLDDLDLPTSLPDLISEARLSSNWAYKEFGGSKQRLTLKTFSELCYVLQRYTCIRACSHDAMPHARQWLRYSQHHAFLASSDRIRSLIRSEYMWLHDFTSRAEQAVSINTLEWVNIMDGIWGAVIGCPQESGSNSHVGCLDSQRFSKGTDSQPYIRTARGLPENRKVLIHEVVQRNTLGGDPVVSASMPKIGIALVFCEEPVDFLEEVGCESIQYHLYSKCGTTRKQAEEMAPSVAHCFASFKEVPITLETELAWPKHHSQYLEHIIQRYNELEPWTIFVKANLEKRRLNLKDMVQDLLTNKWSFYSFGNPKIKVNMTSFPETGNVPVWQREVCALYRRYTGLDPCQMDDEYMREIHFEPYYYNTRSMWSASNKRIQSLPITEYQWMREYLMSVTFEEGVKRRYVPERMWQGMLGCPAELHTRQMVGCTAQQWHPSGQAVEPPGVMIADALVSWPQISPSTFSPNSPYPSFFHIHNATKITFVGTYIGPFNAEWQVVMTSVLVTAAKMHPDCSFVMLTDMETPQEMFLPEMWLGRMQIRRYDVDIPNKGDLNYKPDANDSFISFYQAHAVNMTEQDPRPDYKAAGMKKWIMAYTYGRLVLEACFMRDAMAATQQGAMGHLVLMDFTSYLMRNVAPVFGERLMKRHPLDMEADWDVAMTIRSVSGREVASSSWFVHKDHFLPAYALITSAAQMTSKISIADQSKGESWMDHHSLALSNVLRCCLDRPPSEWAAMANASYEGPCRLERCGIEKPPPVHVKLQPCSKLQATVGGSFPQECPLDHNEPESTYSLKWGFWEFTSMVYSMFKLKDKSSSYVPLKSAIRDFVTVYGSEYQTLSETYESLLQRLIDP